MSAQSVASRLSFLDRYLTLSLYHILFYTLNRIHRKIKLALDTKRILGCYMRRSHATMDKIRCNVEADWSVYRKLEETFKVAEQDMAAIVDRQAKLKEAIHQEGLKQQQAASRATETRHATSVLEQEIDDATQRVQAMKKKLAELKQVKAAKAKAHKDKMASLQKQIGDTDFSVATRAEMVKSAQSEMQSKKKSLQEIWGIVIQTQKDYGHQPSAPFSETDELPILDIARLQATVDTEAKAVEDETTAKQALESDATKLQDQLKALKLEETELAQKQPELKAKLSDQCLP